MDLTELIRRRDLYLAAEEAILVHTQSYSVDGITYNRADLGKVQAMIRELNTQIENLSYVGTSNRACFGDRE